MHGSRPAKPIQPQIPHVRQQTLIILVQRQSPLVAAHGPRFMPTPWPITPEACASRQHSSSCCAHTVQCRACLFLHSSSEIQFGSSTSFTDLSIGGVATLKIKRRPLSAEKHLCTLHAARAAVKNIIGTYQDCPLLTDAVHSKILEASAVVTRSEPRSRSMHTHTVSISR